MKNQLKVIYTDWGIANNFGDVIEINKNLKENKKLRDAIIKHELRHTNEMFTVTDLINDLSSGVDIDQLEMIKFILRNPKSWLQLAPIYFTKSRGIVYDLNLGITYLVFILGSLTAIWLGITI